MCFQHGPHRKWEAGPGTPQESLLSSLCCHPRIRAPRPFYSTSRRQWVLRNVCVTLGARRYPRSLVSRLHLWRCVRGSPAAVGILLWSTLSTSGFRLVPLPSGSLFLPVPLEMESRERCASLREGSTGQLSTNVSWERLKEMKGLGIIHDLYFSSILLRPGMKLITQVLLEQQ